MTTQKNKLNVLIVDDEKMICDMLDEFLSSQGYKVQTALNGRLGLEILKKSKIDIVISDYKMPEMSGTEFLEKVFEQYPDTVRLLITGYPDTVNTRDAINRCGVIKYLVKPIDLKDLQEAIDFGVKYLVSQRTKTTKLKQLEKDLDRLIQLSLAFSNETDLSNLLQMILYEAEKFTESETSVLYIVKNDKILLNEVLSKSLDDSLKKQILNSKMDIEGNTIPQFVAKTGEIIRIGDTEDFQFKNIIELRSDFISKSEFRERSILGVPIKSKQMKVLGIIKLVQRENEKGEYKPFTDRDEDIVRSLSALAGSALENLSLINELQEHNDRKSRFMTILGHELRTPVAILNEYINILADGQVDSEEMQKEILSTSLKNIENLKELVEAIVDIAKKDYQIEFEKISMKTYIKKAINTYYDAIKERKIAVQISKSDDIIIEAEPSKFLILLKNLISNAIKYTPDGGTIRFIIRKLDYIAELVIQDTGIGIPKDELAKIFDGFKQQGDENVHSTSKTKFMGGGIGLGLFISRQIIEEHNGKITAESEGVGKGSKFIINLPITQSI